MADLPIELWHLIFDHLELTDLRSCALVCKTLYIAVKAYRVREIAFTRRVYRWFHREFCIYQRQVDYSMTFLLRRSSFSLEYLKRLKIGQHLLINLITINKFAQLEELDIDLRHYKINTTRTLRLANLKVLYLFMSNHLPYLELYTPRLTKVSTPNLEKLDFIYPDSIRCIHTFFHCGKLLIFPNLEYLTFTTGYRNLDYFSPHDPKIFQEFNLTPLKNLKEVEFVLSDLESERNNLSNIRKEIANLLALRRPDLKVFWQSVQVTDPNLLNEYSYWNTGSIITFQLQHHEKLKEKIDFLWTYRLNYSMKKLTQAGFDPRSEEFTSKFLNRFSFRKIRLSGEVKEEGLLMELIARSPILVCLEFCNSNLDQGFFNRMAETARLNGIPLRYLHLKNASNESLNLEFVLKLRRLELFETDQGLPNDKLISKLKKLPLLTKIQFASGNLKIERMLNGRFRLIPRLRIS